MTFKVYIPARYASTRLPGKPLITVAGKTLLQHVYDRVCQSGALEVVVATEDERIAFIAKAFGAEVCLTSASHQSGTDRIAEAVSRRREKPDTVIVNVQGDEPSMPPSVVRQTAALVENSRDADIGTVCEPLLQEADWRDPNQVKVLRDVNDRALYFSRAPIPFQRDATCAWRAGRKYRRHVGIYAYRAAYLKHFVALKPDPLELAECLEQLRALADGARIIVPDAIAACGVGIDSPTDLARFEAEYGENGSVA